LSILQKNFRRRVSEIQQYLMRIALLVGSKFETCARSTENHISAFWPALVRGNVLCRAVMAGGEEYRLHPLFQVFCAAVFALRPEWAGVAAEHAGRAYFLERRPGNRQCGHLLEEIDFERAATIIETGTNGSLRANLVSLVRLVSHCLQQQLRRIRGPRLPR